MSRNIIIVPWQANKIARGTKTQEARASGMKSLKAGDELIARESYNGPPLAKLIVTQVRTLRIKELGPEDIEKQGFEAHAIKRRIGDSQLISRGAYVSWFKRNWDYRAVIPGTKYEDNPKVVLFDFEVKETLLPKSNFRRRRISYERGK